MMQQWKANTDHYQYLLKIIEITLGYNSFHIQKTQAIQIETPFKDTCLYVYYWFNCMLIYVIVGKGFNSTCTATEECETHFRCNNKKCVCAAISDYWSGSRCLSE